VISVSLQLKRRAHLVAGAFLLLPGVAYPLAIRLDIEGPYRVKKSTEAKLHARTRKK